VKRFVAAALFLAACDGDAGTIVVSLATAPDSDLLASLDKLRITTTNPESVTEATRGSNGIDLSVKFDSTDTPGTIYVEGFDSAGTVVATGQSGPFTLAGGDASLVIYVAKPYSINEAPVRLGTGRSSLAASPIVYGAVIAGGVDGAGSLTDQLSIYNVYSHSFQVGAAMPSKRRGQAINADISGVVYLFGGTGENGTTTSTFYEFISTTAPSGSYLAAEDQAGFERTDEVALQVGPTSFVVTGNPPLAITAGAITARSDLPALKGNGASYPKAPDGLTGAAAALSGDGNSLVVFDNESSAVFALPHTGSVAALPDGSFVVAGLGDAMHVTDTVTTLPSLSVARNEPTVAATSRYVVVAGGLDAAMQPIASADILDATTLALVTTVPILPRAHAQAVAMPNEQVMLVGGDVASDVIELFTPPVPTD
jgi:hypothetical protein